MLRVLTAVVFFGILLLASWTSISRIRADSARAVEDANVASRLTSQVIQVEFEENALFASPAPTAMQAAALASTIADLKRSLASMGTGQPRDALTIYVADAEHVSGLLSSGNRSDALAFENNREEPEARAVIGRIGEYASAKAATALSTNHRADRLSLAVHLSTVVGLAVGVGAVWALQRRAEVARRKAIEQQEARFRAMVEHGGDAILLIEESGLIAYASDSSQRVLKRPPGELVGAPLEHIAASDDRARLAQALESARGHPDRAVPVSLAIGRDAERSVELIAVDRTHDPAVGALVVNARDTTERRLAQAALARSDRLLTDLLEHAPVIVYIKDLDGRYRRVNAAWQQLVGRSEVESLGVTADALFEPATATFIAAADRRALEEGAYEAEEQLVIAGRRRLMLTTRFPLIDPSGSPYAVAGISLDVSERIRLEDVERQVGAVVTHAPDAMFASRQGRITTWNPAAEELFGYTAEEIVGSDVAVLVDERDRAQVPLLRERVAAGGVVEGHEMWGRRRDGSTFIGSLIASPLRDPSGAIVGVSSIVRDVTAQHEQREELIVQARTDALTGLPNRAAVMDELRKVLDARRSSGGNGLEPPMLIVFGLDRFRLINDALGQDAGDRVLQVIAKRVAGAAGAEGFAARLGADEFVLLHHPGGSARSADELARDIQLSIAERLDIGSDSITVTASVGMAVGRDARASAWLRDAGSALGLAKLSGPGHVALYDEQARQQSADDLLLANDLRAALQAESLLAYYQPIVDLSSGNVVGFEALARWQHPQRGLVGPDRFVRIAEESGLVVDLGRQIRLAACHQLAAWQSELARDDLEMSMNVSVQELVDQQFIADLEATMSAAGVDPRTVVLEITESALAESSQVMHVLEEAMRLGVRLAIDDFGTGYSSLGYLLRFPVSHLKIDRSFVVASDESAQGVAVLRSVIDLAGAMKLTTIAEGIETEQQWSVLAALGCDHGQGYLWGRPAPADTVLSGLRAAAHAVAPSSSEPSGFSALSDSTTMRARKLSNAGASAHTIAAILNREGVRNRGRRWSATAVEGLLERSPQ